jgi:predicted small metal-binding protein
VSAATEEELMAKVSEHVRKVHKVRTTTDTIANFVRLKMRTR